MINHQQNRQQTNRIEYPREALITTAVNFLQNSKVRHTTLKQKQQFLKSKGLTAAEVQTACERAGIFAADPNADVTASTFINMGIKSSTETRAQLALHSKKLSPFAYIKNILHSMAFLSGVAYMVYMFWRYLETFLMGTKQKSVHDILMDIDRKVDTSIADIKAELAQIQIVLSREQNIHNDKFIVEMNQFKSDLDAIKGLLLNRKQFANPINIGPPSIPSWQLETSTDHHSDHNICEPGDNDKQDDATSGSGSASGSGSGSGSASASGSASSETDVATKHSDSSLEMVHF